MNYTKERVNLTTIKDRLRANGLMISSSKEIDEILTELILDRIVGGVNNSLTEVMRVAQKKIVQADHLRLAINTLTL